MIALTSICFSLISDMKTSVLHSNSCKFIMTQKNILVNHRMYINRKHTNISNDKWSVVVVSLHLFHLFILFFLFNFYSFTVLTLTLTLVRITMVVIVVIIMIGQLSFS